jgi:hypothetical protein
MDEAGESTTDARAFLAWSMGRYAALKTFRAAATWHLCFRDDALRVLAAGVGDEAYADAPAPFRTDRRTIAYAAPNRFRVTDDNMGHGKLVHLYVCDGETQVNIPRGYGTPVERFPAPASFAGVERTGLYHSHFGGSALYRFFAGPEGIDTLASSESEIAFGPDVTVDREPCRTVRFHAGRILGETWASIGAHDGLVRRLQYFSEGRLLTPDEIERYSGRVRVTELPPTLTTETYANIETDAMIPDETFRVDPSELPPLPPLGEPAPEFALTPLDGGKPVRLSDLRGRVVLLDLGALFFRERADDAPPESLRLHQEEADRGLSVLTVLPLYPADIPDFASSLVEIGAADLPLFADAGLTVSRAYGCAACSSAAVIDRSGNLSALLEKPAPAAVRAALEAAGL